MVSHTQLQYYSHNYALVCMTGLLGCRWHRYKQSTKSSRKRDLAWFAFVLLVSVFAVFWFYSVLVGRGDITGINRFMYDRLRKWVDWNTIMLVVVSVFFSYLLILMFLSLCHIVQGHQVYIHPVHLVFTCIILSGLVTLAIIMLDLATSQAVIIYFSLKVFGPFLQIGAVCLLTVLTWVISHQWFKISHTVWKAVWMVVYILILVGLYISPLLINSPCVITQENLPARPRLAAHRGASSNMLILTNSADHGQLLKEPSDLGVYCLQKIAPENTVISFEIASQYNVFAFETNVQISSDGTPFLMHDSNLRATTNVEQVFPDLTDADPSSFNITQLQQLDTGSWFLEFDPWHNAGSLPSELRMRYSNQTVPTLLEVLQLAARTSTHVIFDIYPLPSNHPFHNITNQVVMETIKASGINQSLIFWIAEDGIPDFLPSSFSILSTQQFSIEYLKDKNVTGVHYENGISALDRIKTYRDGGLFTSVYIVDTVWLYSFYWCVGVDMVHTDICDVLSELETPLWHLAPSIYRAVWLTVDLVSVVLVVIMFLIQRSRAFENKYKPEHLSLNTNTDNNPWGHKRTRRSMKEKLLMKDVQSEMFDFEPDENLGIESSSYDATVSASEGRALSQAFQANRASYHSNITELSQDGLNSNRHSVTSGYDENGVNLHAVGGQGDSYDANRNSYHSNGTTYQTEAEIT